MLKVPQVYVESLEHKGGPEDREVPVRLDQRVYKDPPAPKGLPVLKGPQESVEKPGRKVPQVCRARQVL